MGYNAKPNKPNKYMSGYYKLINESKYAADPTKIVFRSSLEYKFCSFIDKNPKVLRWASENIGIPYYSNIDNKTHTYYVDYYIEVVNPASPCGYDRMIIEVKPSQEVERIIKNVPPEKPKNCTLKSLKNWEYALSEFYRNKCKWSAAVKWATSKGIIFKIVTEKTINEFFKV